jgi:hypothetical protein
LLSIRPDARQCAARKEQCKARAKNINLIFSMDWVIAPLAAKRSRHFFDAACLIALPPRRYCFRDRSSSPHIMGMAIEAGKEQYDRHQHQCERASRPE